VPFVRFVTAHNHPNSDEPRGLFSALYDLERQTALSPAELAWFHEQEAWFNAHLRKPDRLARSARPNATARALSWFRDTATEHITRMRALAALLQSKDVAVDVIMTDRPGYIVYEDEHQVAAEPFRGD